MPYGVRQRAKLPSPLFGLPPDVGYTWPSTCAQDRRLCVSISKYSAPTSREYPHLATPESPRFYGVVLTTHTAHLASIGISPRETLKRQSEATIKSTLSSSHSSQSRVTHHTSNRLLRTSRTLSGIRAQVTFCPPFFGLWRRAVTIRPRSPLATWGDRARSVISRHTRPRHPEGLIESVSKRTRGELSTESSTALLA